MPKPRSRCATRRRVRPDHAGKLLSHAARHAGYQLIEESPDRPAGDDERRRYFRLTRLGGEVAAAEARRLQAAVLEAPAKRLVTRRG